MSGIQIGLGEITDINVSNFMRIAAVAGPGNAAYDRFLSSLIDKSDGALKGVTDPIEKILSAVFTHVQEKGLSGEFLNKYNRFTEAIDSGEKMSGASKSFYDALHRGQFIYNATDLPSPARVTPAAAPAAPTAPPPAPTPPPTAPPPVSPPSAPAARNPRLQLASKSYKPRATTLYDSFGSISLNHGYKLHFDPINYDEKTINQINDVLGEKFYFKHGGEYGPGKEYTLYAQSLENRDEAIRMIEEDPRISSLIKNNADILDSESLIEGNIEFSPKTTGRFTTEYSYAAANQNIAGETIPDFSIGRARAYQRVDAVADETMTLNRYSKYNWLETADDGTLSAAEDISHLKANFPQVYEFMTGKLGYKSPYTTGLLDQVLSASPPPAAPTPPPAPPAAPTPPPAAPTPPPAASNVNTVQPQSNVTAAGAQRQMVPANFSKMSDDELVEGYKASLNRQAQFTPEQLADPKGFANWGRSTIAAYERELKKRGLDPSVVTGNVSTAAKTATDTTSTRSTLKVGGTTDVRTQPKARGTDGASGGKVTPSGTAHTVADTKDLTTKNTNPKTTAPKAQAKVVSQDVASTAERIKPATNRPSRVTTKGRDLVDNGLRTAQDLAGGNARLMGIAAAAGLLGLGVAATRKKNQPRAEADTTYLADSRRRMQY